MNDPITEDGRFPLAVKAFGITDTGRVRDSNEDQFLIAELTKTMRIWHTSLPKPKARLGDEHAHLFLVADGMGGHRAGEQASALAVTAIEQFTLNTFKWFFQSDDADAQRVLAQFRAALGEADARILEESVEHPEWRGMGTTLTMAYYLDGRLCVVHVGDSRAYMFENDTLHQITQDHTLMAELIRQGTLRPEEAVHHRLRNVITNVVGGNEAGVNVESHALEITAGDRLLLCSDGLSSVVTDERIEEIMRAQPVPTEACQALVDEANGAGGPDNVTTLILQIDAP
jgi:protein phosphatase